MISFSKIMKNKEWLYFEKTEKIKKRKFSFEKNLFSVNSFPSCRQLIAYQNAPQHSKLCLFDIMWKESKGYLQNILIDLLLKQNAPGPNQTAIDISANKTPSMADTSLK